MAPIKRKHDKGADHGNSKWQRLATQWIELYPICLLCLVRGKINDGALMYSTARQRDLVVDHIERHGGHRELFWDADNLTTLCRRPCHDQDKATHERSGKTGQQWLDYLRCEMRRCGTEELVREMSHAVPVRVLQALLD